MFIDVMTVELNSKSFILDLTGNMVLDNSGCLHGKNGSLK